MKSTPADRRAESKNLPLDLPANGGPGWPIAKCLTLVPQAYALSLAYGINVLTGEPSPAGQWLVRNMVVWHRPNPAVGALADKYRPSTSYITIATRARDRWFDLTAVRTLLTEPAARQAGTRRRAPERHGERETGGDLIEQNAAGAPPLDCWFDEHEVWTVTTAPSSLAHYAMWPPKLAERLVLSMCPADVCSVCGEPRRRITQRERMVPGTESCPSNDARQLGGHTTRGTTTVLSKLAAGTCAVAIDTLGWTDCGCDYMDALRRGITPAGPQKWIPGTVLDPFAGTGTTLCVADMHGRDTIGIDIDARNELLMDQRYAECRRALFGVRPELPGQEQLDIFAEAAS